MEKQKFTDAELRKEEQRYLQDLAARIKNSGESIADISRAVHIGRRALERLNTGKSLRLETAIRLHYYLDHRYER